jgi:hypothetical protein
MSNEKPSASDADNLLSAWIRAASNYWESVLRNWPVTATGDTEDKTEAETGRSQSRTHESLESVIKTWQTISAVANDPGAMEVFSSLGHAVPNALMKIVQSSWQGVFELQQQWMEKTGRIGQKTQAYSFDNLEEETFKVWTDIYDKEFRQYFNMPQLGLTRVYQEKFNQCLDKTNRFQATLNEFLYIFYLPIEKSFRVLQDEVTRMAQEGKLAEDANTYYKMWIKILEGHYMTLYKSPEYSEIMRKTLDDLAEVLLAREAITQDLLKSMSVPNQSDLDDLYKEIYLLKKKVRKLEKSQKKE